MRCYNCIALEVTHGCETGATDECCLVGEPEHELKNGEFGCRRRSIEKLRNDIRLANEKMARDMGAMADYVLSETADGEEERQ